MKSKKTSASPGGQNHVGVDTEEGLCDEELDKEYKKMARAALADFQRSFVDPASTANRLAGRKSEVVLKARFQSRLTHIRRMNAGWMYQYLAKELAAASKRFSSVSDLATAEDDFTASVPLRDGSGQVNMYVSVKNRIDTIKGSHWPKAIEALEDYAAGQKNTQAPYTCIFGMAMQRGGRFVKVDKKGNVLSNNTEVWRSDFFWQFFTGFSYYEVTKHVLEFIRQQPEPEIRVPPQVSVEFQRLCREKNLVNEEGLFGDPDQLLRFFCGAQNPRKNHDDKSRDRR